MPQPPEPPETIPDFLVEYLEQQPTETLERVVEYLIGPGGYDQAPQRIVEAASMQDDGTVAKLASFSSDALDFLESSEYDTLAEAHSADEPADDDDGDDDDAGDDTMALRYGSL